MPKKLLLGILLLGAFYVAGAEALAEEAAPAESEPAKRLIELKEGSVELILSDEWQLIEGTGGNNLGALFSHEDPKGLFSIELYPVQGTPLRICNEYDYQFKFLSRLKESLHTGKTRLRDRSALEVPVLIQKGETEKDGRYEDYHFLKDCRYGIIGIRAEKKALKKLWPEIKKAMNSLEFPTGEVSE